MYKKSASSIDTKKINIRHLSRTHPSHYLVSLFAPKAIRHKLWLGLALHCELVSISRRLKERILVQVRLQWWHETVVSFKEGHHTKRKHPLIDHLQEISAEDKEIDNFLLSMIEAHQEKVNFTEPQDWRALLQWAQSDFASLQRLWLYMLERHFKQKEPSYEVFEISNRLSACWGVLSCLQASRFFLERRQMIFPSDIWREKRIDPSDFYKKEGVEYVADMIENGFAFVEKELRSVQNALSDIPDWARPVFYFLPLSAILIAHMRKCRCDIRHQQFSRLPALALPRLLWQGLGDKRGFFSPLR